MEKTILFLGAGTSKAFGYPLTGEILGEIMNKINNATLFNDDCADVKKTKLYRKLLKELLSSLSPGLINYLDKKTTFTNNQLPLVTDLLSQLDHIIYSGQDIKDWNFEVLDLETTNGINERWDLKNLKVLFEWAIINVIKSVAADERVKLNPFIKWIQKLSKSKSLTIITTNYDYSIEWNLLDWGQAAESCDIIDYGFSWRSISDHGAIHMRPEKPDYRIYKLHGSTDWLKCDRCGYIYINTCQNIVDLAFSDIKTDANSCHCSYWPLRPVLVTPSYIRNTYDTNLHEIWKAAAEELRLADEWILAGYSMPSEDFNIKSLLLKSLHGRKKKPNVKVIQYNDAAKQRYDNFFNYQPYEYFSEQLENYSFR